MSMGSTRTTLVTRQSHPTHISVTHTLTCDKIISMTKPNFIESGFYCIVEMPTQSNFANLIGLSREAVSRVSGRLRSDGLVEISGNDLHILDRKGLENRAFGQSF